MLEALKEKVLKANLDLVKQVKKVDTSNVQEAGEQKRLPAGAYNCVIRKVEDFPDREYLKVSYDIAEGEFAGHFDAIRADHPDWAWIGAYVKSYKTNALPMFKRFCSAVSKSNGNFVFDGGAVNSDETTLIGKKLGIVLKEEEYYTNSGEIRTRLVVHTECPIEKLSSQKVPPCKKLIVDTAPANGFISVPDGSDEAMPW